VSAATIAVLPAPVLPSSHTTGAIACARLRASSMPLPGARMSSNKVSLMALQSRSRSPTSQNP
jgi:hypothetical protein